MSTSSTELREFSDYLLDSCSLAGEQKLRTAAHKLYYSMYHLYIEKFPEAFNHPEIRDAKLGRHGRFIAGLRKISRDHAKRNQVLQCADALQNLKGIRSVADYEINADFSEGDLKVASDLAQKLQRKYHDHFEVGD